MRSISSRFTYLLTLLDNLARDWNVSLWQFLKTVFNEKQTT